MTDWIPRQRIFAFLDKLQHVRHPEYDTIAGIRECVENLDEAEQELADLEDDLERLQKRLTDLSVPGKELGDKIRWLSKELDTIVDATDRFVPEALPCVLAGWRAQWEVIDLMREAGVIPKDGRPPANWLALLRMFLPVD